METQKEVFTDNKLVYFADFGQLLIDIVDETIESSRGEQFGCCDFGFENNPKCNCINKKSKRNGTPEWFMSAGLLDLETACKIVAETANKIISGLKEKSFNCDCPSLESEEAIINQIV